MMTNLALIEELARRKQAEQGTLPPIVAPTAPVNTLPAIPADAGVGTGSAPVAPVAGRERIVSEPPPLPFIPANFVNDLPGSSAGNMPLTPEQSLAEINDPGRYKKGGKGRNEKWSTWEKVASALAGWAQGGLVGGVQAGTDRNYFNKIGDQNERERLLPAIAAQQQIADYDLRQDAGRTNIANTIDDNARMREELGRKKNADKTKAAYYDGLLKDKKRGREMESEKIADLRTYREWLISNGDKNTDAKVKQIDERLKDYDLDRESKEKIAGMTQEGQNARLRSQQTFTAQQNANKEALTRAIRDANAADASTRAAKLAEVQRLRDEAKALGIAGLTLSN